MSEPLPETVKVLPLKLALPATPTAPMSWSVQPAGKPPLGALTISVTFAVCDKLPLVPFTAIVFVPAGVEANVVTVMVEGPEPATEAGLKLAVAPVGKPVALKVTDPLKPLMALTVAV